jgi:hypothetical protein
MSNTKKSIEEIQNTEGQTLTPYEVFRLWQHAIDTHNIDRELKPQMAYNYDRNGLIVKGRSAKETKIAGRYTVEEANAFVAKWLMKNYKIEAVVVTESDECDGQEDLLELIEAE